MERGISLAIEKFGPSWSETCHPDAHTLKVLSHIHDCRTEAMGGRRMACPECGTEHIAWNSCRDRHCPNCQSAPREAWLLSRKEELIPATYFHMVFTLPSCLTPSVLANKQEGYTALFHAAWDTIKEFAKKQSIQMGMTAILHTWGSNLSFHPHIHCIVPGGGVRTDGKHWKALPQVKDGKGTEPFLFPVKALSQMFRAKWMELFTETVKLDGATREECFSSPWVVYAKSPVCGVDKTLEYLARYAYRVAISNNRIEHVGDDGVRFAYKDYRDGGKNKSMLLEGTEFVRRYAQHVNPPRFVRIRHYGFLAPGNRSKLADLQKKLGCAPVPKRKKRKSWNDICTCAGITAWLCKECRIGILILLEVIPRVRSPEHLFAHETG